MDEQEKVDPIYKKGFEQGYWLQRGNSPDLSKALQQAGKNSSYVNGMKAGQKEATREQFKSRMAQAKDRSAKDRDRGMDRG